MNTTVALIDSKEHHNDSKEDETHNDNRVGCGGPTLCKQRLTTLVKTHTHTHIHTHTHTYNHKYTHSHTQIHSYTHTHR